MLVWWRYLPLISQCTSFPPYSSVCFAFNTNLFTVTDRNFSNRSLSNIITRMKWNSILCCRMCNVTVYHQIRFEVNKFQQPTTIYPADFMGQISNHGLNFISGLGKLNAWLGPNSLLLVNATTDVWRHKNKRAHPKIQSLQRVKGHPLTYHFL